MYKIKTIVKTNTSYYYVGSNMFYFPNYFYLYCLFCTYLKRTDFKLFLIKSRGIFKKEK